MPVDPNTGNRLPYEGEPGYEEAKKKFPELYAAEEGGDEEEMPGDEGPMDADTEAEAEEAPMAGAPEEIVPERDLKPLMDEADQLMVEEDAAEGEEAPEDAPEEEAPEGDEEMPAEDDVGPLMETLGMSKERAEEIMAAAKSIPQYAEMAPQELADLLSRDFQVLMELERTAAALTKPEMPEEAMMEPEAPMA
tara:strand:+ start:15061 stop:15639 length:579 start_codon:yes stop_codon:yes gene_type:complete